MKSIIAWLGLTFLSSISHAGILSSHSRVSAAALVGNSPPPSVMTESLTSMDTGVVHDHIDREGFPYIVQSEARAATRLIADRLLAGRASAYIDNPGTAHSASGHANQSWRDIAFTGGTVFPHIVLRFSVRAGLTVEACCSNALLSVNTSADVRNGWDKFFEQHTVQFQGDDYAHEPPGPPVFGVSGFDTWSFDAAGSGDFIGYFHIEAPYDAELGGYDWGVSLALTASTTGSHAGGAPSVAVIDAFNTLGLQQVMDSDGNAIDVTFDSGLTMSAIPEPSSLMLLGTSALICLLTRRSRTCHV